MNLNRLTLVALGLLAALGGCGGPAPDGGNGASPADAARRRQGEVRVLKRPLAAAVKRETVAAVPLGKPGAPVDLRFEISERPRLGQALEILLEITPRSVVGRLQITVQANDGLTLAGDGQLEAVERPIVDELITRTVIVKPQREGVFDLTVIVSVDDATSSLSRTFAIPVIVGDPGGLASAQKPETVMDATQQRLERLPAQESSSSR